MELDMSIFDKDVDHFLISTRENQLLVLFVEGEEEVLTWEN